MKKIEEWIGQADGKNEKDFRQVIHMILVAISRDKNLSHTLVIKGGIVMSLVYGGDRYTSDLDASSLDKPSDLTMDKLNTILGRQLKAVIATSEYNLDCKIHSIKPQPSKKSFPNASFPAYKVKIGYADKSQPSEMKQLASSNASHTVEVDISFNETVTVEDIDAFQLNEKQNVLYYNLEQIMAEKFRSLLQQPVRRRNRRQDVFDLHHLLQEYDDHFRNAETKSLVLEKLIKSSIGRGLDAYLHQKGMLDPEVRKRSLEDVSTLEQEVEIKENIETMYDMVSDYFQSLPWDD
jgi:predicted nucleotidyltransferase component of viral defense system